MAISRISSATNNGTTITLGTHAKGDLILFFAYNNANGTIPTLPASVIDLQSHFIGTAWGRRTGFVIARSSNESIGTSGWTNASNVTAIVYRAGSGLVLVPTFLSFTGASASQTTHNFPAQGANTYKTNNSDLWLVGFHSNKNASNSLSTLAPTGMTNVINSIGTGFEVAVHDTNATRTTAWPSTNVTVTNSTPYSTQVVELLEFDPQLASGGGFILPRPMNGGYSA